MFFDLSGPVLRASSTFLLILVLTCFSGQAYARILDYIVALVDSEVILNSELQEYRAIVEHQISSDQKVPSDSEILEEIVMRTIQLNRARAAGIRISDNRLNQLLVDEAQRQNLDPANIIRDFENFPGGLESYRKYLRDNMTIRELQRIAIQSLISITELDARHFLATELGRSSSQLIYELAFLSMPADTVKSDNNSSALEEIIQIFRQDIEFKQQLEQIQDSYAWIAGKRLDPRAIGNLPTIFSDIAPIMSVDEVSEPIYDGDTAYLLKVLSIRGAEPSYQDQVKARHILIKPSVIRNQEQTRLLLSRLRSQISDGESFEHVARTYTEDPGTQNNGGDLGWQAYSFFTGAFRDKLQQLPLLDISEPFQTALGWHIAQVLERKQVDISEKLEIDRIRNYLFQQKINDELPRWLNQLRETSYVEIRDSALTAIGPGAQ